MTSLLARGPASEASLRGHLKNEGDEQIGSQYTSRRIPSSVHS
jgi:hypothetical protein